MTQSSERKHDTLLYKLVLLALPILLEFFSILTISLLLGTSPREVHAGHSPAQADGIYKTNIILLTLSYILQMLIGYYFLTHYHLKKSDRVQDFLRLKKPKKSHILSFAFWLYIILLLPNLVGLVCKDLVGLKEPQQAKTLVKIFTFQGPYKWGLLLISGVLGPIWEELVWRGFFMSILRRQYRLSYKIIIPLQGVLFGLMHLNYSYEVFLGSSIAGMIFGWLCIRQQSIVPGIIIHMLNNIMCVFLVFAQGDITI